MAELAHFNAFGLVKVTRTEVTVTITAVTIDGKPINRNLLQEFETPLEMLGVDDFLSASFGVMIEPKRSRIAYNDLAVVIASEPVDLPKIGEVPGVSKAMAKAIDLVRKVQ